MTLTSQNQDQRYKMTTFFKIESIYIYLVYLAVIFSRIHYDIGVKISVHTVSVIVCILYFTKSFSQYKILCLMLIICFSASYLTISANYNNNSVFTFALIITAAILAYHNHVTSINYIEGVSYKVLAFIPVQIIYYLIDVMKYGDSAISNTVLWNESVYAFRLTYGNVFALQGFSQNPNIVLFPFIIAAYYSINILKKNKITLALVLFGLLVIAVLSNSRGNMVLLIVFYAYIIRKKLSLK